MKRSIYASLAVWMAVLFSVTAFAQSRQLLLASSKDAFVLEGGRLEPGKEYSFPLLIAENGKTMDLTEENLGRGYLQVTVTEGEEMIRDAAEEWRKGKGSLWIQTAEVYRTEDTDVTMRLKWIPQNSSRSIASLEVHFTVGQDRMDNRTVDSIGEGEALVINNTAPILGAEMLENFAKKNSYRRIRLEGSGWYYENQLHDMPDSNFFSSKKADLDIVSNYSDSDFYFLSFPATPEFAAKGKLSIDLSEIPDWNAEEYDLYRSLDGVLYRLKADYDETEKSLSITTDTLGSYFISNAKIPNGTALQNQRILNPDTGWTDTLQRAESVLRLALTADTL